MINEELLQRAETGDLEALAELDRQGLLIGADESLEDYGKRLRCLQANIAKMDAELAGTGRYEVEDLAVEQSQRIPPEIFAEPRQLTQQLFGFQIDWVPGFFINPRGAILFGGCAYFFYPDFFALFIIRRAFATAERWLIYRRSELLAHELCHIARLGLDSVEHEETFAYRTSTSSFRRLLGGIFRSQWDSYSFLGSAFAILAGRLLQILRFPSLIQWPFWLPLIICLLFQGSRHTLSMRRLARARQALLPTFADQTNAALFRSTDTEIAQLAAHASPAQTQAWLDERRGASCRWRVSCHRFASAPPSGDSVEA
ncbi:MAG: hypothetical protein HN849_28945 [Victivallales bacterium]|nr:hypothetical protein [Victivallales bacterium]